MYRIGSLFAGIGGFELGLERALPARTVWQVEIDPECRRVLRKHWPHASRHVDVRRVAPGDLLSVDIVCGGFPCQNVSSANVKTREGLQGAKSGLWAEFARVVRGLAPRWVVVENVSRGAPWVPSVRRDLWALGYSSLSIRLRADQFGARHRRDRTFVLAHADREGESLRAVHAKVASIRSLPSFDRDGRAAPPGGFRLAHGLPRAVERNRQYGNAVMPIMAEFIGGLIACTD